MTTLARFTIGLLIALLTASCGLDINIGQGKRGNGVVTDDRREVTEEFTVVSASEGLDVYVSQADEFEILVEADENIIDLIGTDIRDGELRIHAIENIGNATKKVFVSLPVITGLESSSGADLTTRNRLKADRISLDASSGSNLRVEITADEVEADTSSGADIQISGEANLFNADASSGSGIRARDFAVKTCYADASSGADIDLNVSESLTADASSGADISYTGDPSVQQSKSVSGSVHKD
jgi:hypothetical protein